MLDFKKLGAVLCIFLLVTHPIAAIGQNFNGTLLGNGKTITGLNLQNSSSIKTSWPLALALYKPQPRLRRDPKVLKTLGKYLRRSR